MTVLAAQGVVAETITDHGDVRDLRADGALTAVEDEPVVTGDTVVLRVHSERVNDTFAATDGANATLSVVVDTSALALVERGTRDPIAFEPELDQFAVTVETRGRSQTDAFDDEFTLSFPDATVDPTTADLRFDGSGPARANANTTTLGLSGQTNLLPETTLTVDAVSPDGTTLGTDTVTTTANRSGRVPRDEVQSEFAATLRAVPSDEHEWFALRATAQNRTVWDREVVVGPEPRWSTLSATALGTDGESWTLHVDASLRLPDQGVLEVELRTADGLVTREAAVPDGHGLADRQYRNDRYHRRRRPRLRSGRRPARCRARGCGARSTVLRTVSPRPLRGCSRPDTGGERW